MQGLHLLNSTLAIKHVDHKSELGKMHTAVLGQAWVFPALSQLMACAGGREEPFKSCICSFSSRPLAVTPQIFAWEECSSKAYFSDNPLGRYNQ